MNNQTSPNKSNLNPEGAIPQLPLSIILCILWKIEKGIYPEKINLRCTSIFRESVSHHCE